MPKAWASLDQADRTGLEELGWTKETFDANEGPKDVPWSSLSERQRTLALSLGCDEQVWTEAVEEEKQYRADVAFAATLPERIAASLVSVDEILGELSDGAVAYEEEQIRTAEAEAYAAASKIQAVQRGKSSRRGLAAKQAAATKVQACERGRADRKFVVQKREENRIAEEKRRAEEERQRVLRIEAEKQKARDRYYGAQATRLGLSSFADIRARAAEQANSYDKAAERWKGGTPSTGESMAGRLERLKLNPGGRTLGQPLLVERLPPKAWAQHRPDKWRQSLDTPVVRRSHQPTTPVGGAGSAEATAPPQTPLGPEERQELEARVRELYEGPSVDKLLKIGHSHAPSTSAAAAAPPPATPSRLSQLAQAQYPGSAAPPTPSATPAISSSNRGVAATLVGALATSSPSQSELRYLAHDRAAAAAAAAVPEAAVPGLGLSFSGGGGSSNSWAATTGNRLPTPRGTPGRMMRTAGGSGVDPTIGIYGRDGLYARRTEWAEIKALQQQKEAAATAAAAAAVAAAKPPPPPRSSPRFSIEPSINPFQQLEIDASSAPATLIQSADGTVTVVPGRPLDRAAAQYQSRMREESSLAALALGAPPHSPSPRRRLDVEPSYSIAAGRADVQAGDHYGLLRGGGSLLNSPLTKRRPMYDPATNTYIVQ